MTRPHLAAALVASLFAPVATAGTVTVDFLDVGQGDAILVRGSGKAVLIDAGDRGSDVVGQLGRLGVERLDLVVATHAHADHIGDMADVLAAFDVGLYMDNGLPHTTATYERTMATVESRGIRYRTARAGMALRLGSEATFSVLHPQADPLRGTRSDLNSNSVVLLLEHGDVEFLFLGDAEEPTEALLARNGIDDVDVLKVAHHGSAHSSSRTFLRAVEPDHAVISCGADNRYGHPAPEALERLGEVGAIVYRTDTSGHLRAISNGDDVEILEGTLSELGPGWIAGAAHPLPLDALAEGTNRPRSRVEQETR